jgi:hypothetical protein
MRWLIVLLASVAVWGETLSVQQGQVIRVRATASAERARMGERTVRLFLLEDGSRQFLELVVEGVLQGRPRAGNAGRVA